MGRRAEPVSAGLGLRNRGRGIDVGRTGGAMVGRSTAGLGFDWGFGGPACEVGYPDRVEGHEADEPEALRSRIHVTRPTANQSTVAQ
jgi:hypothetical protein